MRNLRNVLALGAFVVGCAPAHPASAATSISGRDAAVVLELDKGSILCVQGKGRGAALPLHLGPSARHAIVGRIPAGTCDVKLVGRCVDGWCEVEAFGRKGWADSKLIVVRPGQPQPAGGATAAAARAPGPTAPRPGPPATTAETRGPSAPVTIGSAVVEPTKAAEPVAATAAKPYRTLSPAPTAAAAPPASPAADGKGQVPPLSSAPPPVTPSLAASPDGSTARKAETARSLSNGKRSHAAARPVAGRDARREREARKERQQRLTRLEPGVRAYRRPWPFGMAVFEAPRRYVPRFDRSCVVHVAAWDTLRLRAGPGVGHREITGIPARSCGVVRLPRCHGAWCAVRFRGIAGWVNSAYLR